MKFRLSYLFPLLLLAPSLLTLPCSAEAQEISVSFEQQLALGDDEDAPKEYLFGGPQYIRTDTEGRIYVATQSNSIRIFSPEGEYLKTVGRQGKGPGEFVAITGLTFDYRGKLIILDGPSKKLTRFYNMGDSLETQSVPRPDWTEEKIVPIAGNRFASTEIRNPRFFELMSRYVDDIETVDYEDRAVHLLNVADGSVREVEVSQLQISPMHLDDRDRFYYVDWSAGFPVIRVTKIIMGG